MRRHEEGDFDDGDGRPEPTEPQRRRGITPGQILAVVAVVLLVIFAAANFKPVNVNFLLFSSRARVFTVIAVSAILGFVIGYFVGRPGRSERKLLREFRDGKP